MGDFFHGWRRKIGVVTLVIALVFASGWGRSSRVTDIINLSPSHINSLTIISQRSGVVFLWMYSRATHIREDGRIDGSYVLLGQNRSLIEIMPRELQVEWSSQWLGFQHGHARDIAGAKFWVDDIRDVFGRTVKESDFKGLEADILMIPHWSIVMPLTLLSAYLLLVKTRAKTTPAIST